jgi:hypothetical protein
VCSPATKAAREKHAVAGIDHVLERLVTDRSFRDQLAADPRSALAGYDLTTDELVLLATHVSDELAGDRNVEGRTSRSALFSLFTQIDDATTGGSTPGGRLTSDTTVETADTDAFDPGPDSGGDGLFDAHDMDSDGIGDLEEPERGGQPGI